MLKMGGIVRFIRLLICVGIDKGIALQFTAIMSFDPFEARICIAYLRGSWDPWRRLCRGFRLFRCWTICTVLMLPYHTLFVIVCGRWVLNAPMLHADMSVNNFSATASRMRVKFSSLADLADVFVPF